MKCPAGHIEKEGKCVIDRNSIYTHAVKIGNSEHVTMQMYGVYVEAYYKGPHSRFRTRQELLAKLLAKVEKELG